MSAALGFILGRAGSGKTEELFNRIAELKRADDPGPIFVIVPEQESFETEKRLSGMLGGGLFGVTVTSWSGLSRKVLDSLGDRRAFLSPQGRVMLVRRCADEKQKELSVFKRSAAHAGFPAEMDGLIKRFKRCGLGSEDLLHAADKLETGAPLRDKLSDIALIFSDLERRCLDRYIDSEDMMNELLARMDESPLVGSHVFIDGGSVLHEQAFPIFSALLTRAASVTAALDLDPYSRDRGLFFPEARVFERLCDIASAQGVPYTVKELGPRRRPGSPAILHLERELFAYPQEVFSGEPTGLSISVSSGRTDEVTDAAEGILKAVREGCRYRDIAVIVSDTAAYSPIVAHVFTAYGIPYFADWKRSLASRPIPRLILSALKAAESGFGIDHVRELIKSSFFDIDRADAERFENFIIAKGFFGSRLAEPFTGDDEAFEPVRQSLMTPLLRFREGLRGGDCESRIRAIHSFMEELGLYERQRALCADLHERGLFREEEENAQVVNTVLEVLDQLYVIMGGETVGLKKFISVVAEGFASYEVGVIPTTCDQVLVGSVDRTRSREVKRLWVLGMSDGLFPKPRKDDGVIDDGDLRTLRSIGLDVWQSTGALSERDLLTVYSALSKATESITFSYPASAAGGAESGSALPCRLIGSIRELFPSIRTVDGSISAGVRSNEEAAFASLGRRIRRMLDTGEPDGEASLLFAYFSKSPEYREPTRKLVAECFGQEEIAPFGEELSRRLYGGRLYGSASRLEDFNKCPFLHFAKFGLCAQPRKERSMRATDKGTFRHAALEAYVRYVTENELSWNDIDDNKTFEILREIIPPIMADEKNGALYDTARQRAELADMIESIKFTCCALTRHIARGSFRPTGCEVSFGRADSPFPPIVIRTPGGAEFRISGIIDRIDTFEGSNGAMSRIIDYKSHGKEFKFGHLDAGLQLQLPLYAAAIDSARTVGMYYMPVMDVPPVSTETGEAEKQMTEELLKEFRLNGLSLNSEEVVLATEEFDKSSTVIKVKRGRDGTLSGTGLVDSDEYRLVVETAKRRAAAALERILEGDAAISPYMNAVSKRDTACNYCDYKDVCRFDPELSKDGWRKIYPKSADSFFGREKRS